MITRSIAILKTCHSTHWAIAIVRPQQSPPIFSCHTLSLILTVLPSIAFLLSAFVQTSATLAQEQANIGTLKIRADSPLINGEYPRLMITRAELPAIRARLGNPEIQRYLQQARELVKIGKASPLLLATLYQVTGDKQYAALARARLGKANWDPAWTFAFDMIAETMTPVERVEQAKQILTRIEANRWRPRLLHCLAAWGNGLDAKILPYLESSYADEVARRLDYNNRWSHGRGGSSMGHGYNGEHFFSAEFATMMGWTHATGKDVLGRCDFAHNTPAWYVYHYLPWQHSRQVLRVGVTMSPSHIQALTPQKHAGESYVMLDITRTQNGLGQWWEREFIGKWPMPAWRPGEEHTYGLVGRLLWLDPAIPSVPPRQFPETRLFPVNGHVIMRSDWTENATVALFRCGRFGEIDGYGGRNNADNLHFIIYKQGYLAPDTGCVHSVNEKVWKMERPSNVHNYGKQTVAHNSITVGRERLEHRGYQNRLVDVALRGGQMITQDPQWYKAWGIKGVKRIQGELQDGVITAYSTSPAYDYASGDATRSYPPSRVKKITRQFVYLKPDLFVIFDRVTPADPQLDIIWNLHAYQQPIWIGDTQPEESARGEHSGGHFLHTAGDTFRVSNGPSDMVVTTLLPKRDARTVRTVGGKWHDFELNGVNYGPTDATYELLAKRKNGGLEGVAGWRIEVSPTEVAGEAHFLHVLQTGNKNTLKPADITLMATSKRSGAKIVLDNESYEITFNTTGETGGHITVSHDQQTVLDDELVTSVEDNYDRWKTDPRYDAWMTNPYMKTVVFPYGKRDR